MSRFIYLDGYADNSHFDIDKIIVKFEEENVEEKDDQLEINSTKGG